VSELICRQVSGMDGASALPRANGELVFDAPWQGRAFGTALAAVQSMGLDWDEFRSRLIAAIAEEPDRPYYESWVAALERLLVDHGLATTELVDRLAEQARA
jgi:nitrile hydratase accessory protein